MNESRRLRNNRRNRHAVKNPTRQAMRERLDRYRLEKDLTLRMLAQLIRGISHPTLWAFLNGRADLLDRTAFKIERFLQEVGRAA